MSNWKKHIGRENRKEVSPFDIIFLFTSLFLIIKFILELILKTIAFLINGFIKIIGKITSQNTERNTNKYNTNNETNNLINNNDIKNTYDDNNDNSSNIVVENNNERNIDNFKKAEEKNSEHIQQKKSLDSEKTNIVVSTQNTIKENEYKIENDFKIIDKENLSESKKMLDYYTNELLNKIYDDFKIIGIAYETIDKYKFIILDLKCINCGRTIRKRAYNFFLDKKKCTCFYQKKIEWDKFCNTSCFNDFDNFMNDCKKNMALQHFVINPNKKISKQNILHGTYSDLKNFYKSNPNIYNEVFNEKSREDEIKCPNCGCNIKKSEKKGNLPTCQNCSAMIYDTKNYRYELLVKHLYRKKELDTLYELNMGLISFSCSYSEENKYIHIYNTYDNSLSSKYIILNDELYKCGFSKVKVMNAYYMIGNYTLYLNGKGFVNFDNIYFNFNNKNTAPIIFYQKNDDFLEWVSDEKILYDKDLDEIIFICFEKSNNNNITLNYYKNDILIDKYVGIIDVIKRLPNYCLLIKLNNNEKKMFSILNNQWYEYNGQQTDVINFENTNTNISIDMNSNLISDNIKNILKNIKRINNKKYKRVFFQKKQNKNNLILQKYLEKNFKIEKIKNEFDDDKEEIYYTLIDRDDKEAISFVEYITSKNYYDRDIIGGATIYDCLIDDVFKCLLYKINFKNKLAKIINENLLFIFEDDGKKKYIISSIYDTYSPSNINSEKIINKLLKKYNTDEIGLFSILLYKYGEELAFHLPKNETFEYVNSNGSIIFRNHSITDENKKKYDLIYESLDIEEVKWKSEFTMFKLIKLYFDDAIFQYKFKELGLQSLDVYVPSVNIGFEYQGIQHYETVDIFGGEDELKKRIENDKKKKKICKENNIDLIEWKYDEKINKMVLDEKLLHYKQKVEKTYKFTTFD